MLQAISARATPVTKLPMVTPVSSVRWLSAGIEEAPHESDDGAGSGDDDAD